MSTEQTTNIRSRYNTNFYLLLILSNWTVEKQKMLLSFSSPVSATLIMQMNQWTVKPPGHQLVLWTECSFYNILIKEYLLIIQYQYLITLNIILRCFILVSVVGKNGIQLKIISTRNLWQRCFGYLLVSITHSTSLYIPCPVTILVCKQKPQMLCPLKPLFANSGTY